MLALAASGLLAALRLGVEPWVARVAEARLSRRLGAPVQVDRARLGWPARVNLTGIRSSAGSAGDLSVELAPRGLLGGQARVLRATAREVVVAGQGRAAWAELRRDPDGRERLRADAVRHAWLPIAAGSIQVALDDELHARALDLQDGSWDGVTAIEAHATREGEAWAARLRWPGLRATARFTLRPGLAGEGQLHLDDAALPAGALPGLDLGAARATGELRLTGTVEDVRAEIGLVLGGVTAIHPALAARRVEGLGGSITGSLRIGRRGRTLESPRLELRSGGVALAASGALDRDGPSAITVEMGRTRCADLLAALEPLLPDLRGLALAGDLAARVRVEVDARRLADLSLDPDLEVGCEVTRDAPGADPDRLAQRRRAAQLALAPRPSLAELGPTVVRAFLVGEDARFYRHRGFDAWTLRRALAANLEAHAYVRGASTITQQLARNLYLDGERTLSRKLEEAVIAWRLEQALGKPAILEGWLDLVELAPGVRGVTDGARHWFGKEPAALDEREAAALAALAPAPARGLDDAWSRRYRDLLVKLADPRAVVTPAPAARR